MKKLVLLTALLALLSSTFTSCSDDNEIIPPMLGYWKCTGIGGTIGGINTSTVGKDYLKYFSISYVGVGTSGKYLRVGAEDASALASLATSTGTDSWKDFLTTGSYTYTGNASDGTITQTSKGEDKTYQYKISGNSLTLTEVTAEISSGTVNNVLDILGSILGKDIESSVGIVYEYEKMSGVDAFNSLISSN